MENFKNVINSKSLNYWRTKRGLSQKELAEKSKVSIRTINKLENNHENPSQKVHEKVFKQLKNALNCSSKELSSEFSKEKKSEDDRNSKMKEISDKLHKLRSVKVNQTTLSNLEYVGKLYNTSVEEIIDMAAVLFVDFAEKCLDEENENFSKDSFYYLITRLVDTYHSEHHYEKKYDDIFSKDGWGCDLYDFAPDSDGEVMANDVISQIDTAIQKRDIFFKKLQIPEGLMNTDDGYTETYLPPANDYNPINNQLEKLLKTRKMKEIFIQEKRIENTPWAGSQYITFSNNSRVIHYMTDRDTYKEIQKHENWVL